MTTIAYFRLFSRPFAKAFEAARRHFGRIFGLKFDSVTPQWPARLEPVTPQWPANIA